MDTTSLLIIGIFGGIIVLAVILGFSIMVYMNHEADKNLPKLPKAKRETKPVPSSTKSTSEPAIIAKTDDEEPEPTKKLLASIPGPCRILLLDNSEWLLETQKGRFIHSVTGKTVPLPNNIKERRDIETLNLKKGARTQYRHLPVGSMFKTRTGRKGMKGAKQCFDLKSGEPFTPRSAGKTAVRQLLLQKD